LRNPLKKKEHLSRRNALQQLLQQQQQQQVEYNKALVDILHITNTNEKP
jgi:hypothetical protein